MAQMLSMGVKQRQDDWDQHLRHVEFAYNNAVSAATGLAPNQVHLNRLPRFPPTVFDNIYARGHQSLARDQLEYVDLATDRQKRSYQLVRDQHALNTAKIERSNSALTEALRKTPIYTAGLWVWIYNSAATIRQRAATGPSAADNADAQILNAKLSLNWAGPFKVLAAVPSYYVVHVW